MSDMSSPEFTDYTVTSYFGQDGGLGHGLTPDLESEFDWNGAADHLDSCLELDWEGISEEDVNVGRESQQQGFITHTKP